MMDVGLCIFLKVLWTYLLYDDLWVLLTADGLQQICTKTSTGYPSPLHLNPLSFDRVIFCDCHACYYYFDFVTLILQLIPWYDVMGEKWYLYSVHKIFQIFANTITCSITDHLWVTSIHSTMIPRFRCFIQISYFIGLLSLLISSSLSAKPAEFSVRS